MRVLIVFSSSELGGAERSLTRMTAFAGKDVAFDIATLDGDGTWTEWCRQRGLDPIVFGDRVGKHSHGQFGWRAAVKLIGKVRKERYSAVYVIGLRASIMVRLVKPLLRGARLVQGVRWNPNSTSRLDRGFRLTERWLGWPIDLYICNSLAAARTLTGMIGLRPEQISVIHNGLEQVPHSIPDRAGVASDLLTLANFAPRKGLLLYLEQVVLPLIKRHPTLTVTIAGRDDMYGALKDKVAELGLGSHVNILDFQSNVSNLLETSRLFVLPSLWNEGCPTSVLEALSFGCPVIAFALDGIPELVDSGQDGILVPLGNYSDLVDAIDRLLSDHNTRARFGRNGHEKMLNRFHITQMAQKHAAAFRALAQD